MVLHALLPGAYHVGTEERVLVEDVGDFTCELEPPEGPVIAQVDGDGREAGIGEEFRPEEVHDLPGEDLGFEKGAFGKLRDHAAEQVVHQCIGKEKGCVRPDAETVGELQRQPAFHTAVRHDHHLLRQGRRKRLTDHPGQCIREALHAVPGV